MERKDDPAKPLGICYRLFAFLVKNFPLYRYKQVIQGRRDLKSDTEINVIVSEQNLVAVEQQNGFSGVKTRRNEEKDGGLRATSSNINTRSSDFIERIKKKTSEERDFISKSKDKYVEKYVEFVP